MKTTFLSDAQITELNNEELLDITAGGENLFYDIGYAIGVGFACFLGGVGHASRTMGGLK